MISIRARKKLNVQRISCLLEVRVKERRPDLAWLLRKLGRWGLSRGERENMEKYLEDLDLLRSGQLTQEGEKARQSEEVLVPEAGLYELMFTRDKVFGNRAIHYRRAKPRNILEGDTESFSQYELFDERIHQNLAQMKGDSDEFWVKFQRQSGENPKVIKAGTSDADLELVHENGNTVLKFSLSRGKFKAQHEEELAGFDPQRNLSEWIKGWNASISALEVAYKEVKDSPAGLSSFKKTITLKGQHIHLSTGTDEADWEVSITLPIVPKSKKDADSWVYHLIMDHLTQNKRYLSMEKLEELEKDLLKDSPIERKFKDYFQPGDKIMRFLKDCKEKDSFYMVMAVEDVSPTVEQLEGGT